jgi:hypothetical protein
MLSLVDANHHESHIARRAHRRQAEREASLRARLESGAAVVAQQGAVMVTGDRVLFAWDLHLGGTHWCSDAIAFEEVTRWALGRRHDERPLLRLEHPSHVRTERVARHHVLWFSWGNAEADVAHEDTTLAFGSETDEAFQATFARLQQMNIPRGEDFLVALPGTREERRSSAVGRDLQRVAPRSQRRVRKTAPRN